MAIAVEKADIMGNPNIGVYVFANNELAIAPPLVDQGFEEMLLRVLRVKRVVKTKVGDTMLPGVMVAGNDKGILVPRTIRDEELRAIREGFSGNIAIIKAPPNALGNIVVANSRAAMIHRDLDDEVARLVKETLEVEVVVRGTIAGLMTVGSAAVMTNRGGVIHPDAKEEELRYLSDLFKVAVDVSSVNFGVFFVKSGIVANDYGVIVGSRTTGPEILRISRILGGETG
ncbi:MAG: translation initiation factor IF-6 [Sulfolobales archaeon]